MNKKHKLEILVPQYNEDDQIIKFLLDSIAIQQGIDMNEIGVIICNDGSNIYLSDELLSSYKYDISYYKCSHKGVSATRNMCLDLSTADYIMFCDADDMFFSALGLWMIFDEIDKYNFDDLTSEFLSEEIDNRTGKVSYGIYDHDGIFVHGKVFKRQYIIDNKIRFNEKLTICEDCNFVALAQSFTNNHRYVSKPFYIWKWRENSVSRKDKSFEFYCNLQMLESNSDLLEKLLARNLSDIAAGYAVQMVLNFYYMSTSSEWASKINTQEYKTIFDGYINWFKLYGFLWNGVSIKDKSEVIRQLFSTVSKNTFYKEASNIEKWLVEQNLIV